MMKKNMKRSYYKLITENHQAIRELRLEKGWTLVEAARLLGLKSKGLGHLENGRVGLSQERTESILGAYGFHSHDLIRIKKIMKDNIRNKPIRKIIRRVMTNNDRRSYQRIITKEVRVLRALRRMEKLSQDQASSVCGYSRPTISHIENGRIEIPLSRIRHIVLSYGFELSKFEELMKEEVLRDEVIEICHEKLIKLSEEKLKLVQSLLGNI
jgi:transcriptional regulator with XRE-family HTH domain